MPMKKLLLLLTFSVLGGQTLAQNYKVYADNICKSAKSITSKDSTEIRQKQSDILAANIQESMKAQMVYVDTLKVRDYSNQLNTFNYQLIRQVNQTCPNFIYKNYFFLPVTHVVDLDNVLTQEEYKSLKDKILEIRENKSIDILVIEADDWFPMKNIADYSFNILYNWNAEFSLEKGKMIVVFSKNLREIRISTDETSAKLLSEDFLTNTIGTQIVPQFRNGNYYQGIYNALSAINDKL